MQGKFLHPFEKSDRYPLLVDTAPELFGGIVRRMTTNVESSGGYLPGWAELLCGGVSDLTPARPEATNSSMRAGNGEGLAPAQHVIGFQTRRMKREAMHA